MYQSIFDYTDSQMQELRFQKARERLMLAHQTESFWGLSQQLRESAGNVLISLGTRLKPKAPSPFRTVSLGGR